MGLAPDKISFDITLAADLGVEPMEELVQLWTFKRQGTALQLLLAVVVFGAYGIGFDANQFIYNQF